jgi:hypothetical protein
LLGEYAYYNSQSSLVACNLFDVSTADPREHFLASLIVAYLSSNIAIRDQDGFVPGTKLVTEMGLHGFVDVQVRHALRQLAARKLIETPHAHYRELAVPEQDPPERFHFRATSVGIYHIRYWTGSFSFLDAMSIDTPIFDNQVRAKVADLASSFNITDRYTKATAFKAYLEAQWHAANISASFYDFATLLEAQEDSFSAVASALSRGVRANRARFEG